MRNVKSDVRKPEIQEINFRWHNKKYFNFFKFTLFLMFEYQNRMIFKLLLTSSSLMISSMKSVELFLQATAARIASLNNWEKNCFF